MVSSHILTTASLIGLASAACQLKNAYTGGKVPDAFKSDKLCRPQGAGEMTFSLYTSAVEVPTFDGGNPNAGYSGQFSYLIYDNACNLKGAYTPGDNKCGTPYFIEENWLKDVLTITGVDTGVGGAAFSFNYGNGKFTTNNNHCGCQGMGSGLQGAEGCKCSFPQDGTV